MKKIGKRLFKWFSIFGLTALSFILLYISLSYFFSPVNFNLEKITNSNLQVCIFDSEKRPLRHTFLNGDYITLNEIPNHTKQCFISIEDKNFYSHNGLNYKRIISAMLENIKHFKFKEGASTISQQLIKNTHLSSEKSIKRKINEIKLTKKLEKKLSKDEILEYYLNVIYFGDNCYGLENASQHYFSKQSSKLSIDESAMLAGLIKSPNKYHPVKNYENCIKRRNIVLNEMYEDGYIDKQEFEKNLKIDTKTNISNNNYSKMNGYAKASIDEAEKILKIPEKQIALGGYRIFTFMNKEKQEHIENCVNQDINEQCCMISINSKNGQIEAYAEKSYLPLFNTKRQPASSIKPILVYATAINENIISPSTLILDEKIDINGYSPNNIGNKLHGYISAKTALSSSLNIPAVKILSYVGVDKAKAYLERQNISFDEKDNNLAIALGGMTYGVSLKELTNCYQTLANDGEYVKSNYIDYIVDKNGKIVYKHATTKKQIYRDDTAFLVTDILHTCSKLGTAKMLGDVPFYVASKTGTSSISKQNIDAYNISYTTNDVVGVWVGNLDNSQTNIVGGGLPTIMAKNYLTKIYEKERPLDFTPPSSVSEIEIDSLALENEHIVYRANNFLPERYRQKAYFSKFNLPKLANDYSITLPSVKLDGKCSNGVAMLTFNAELYYSYDIYQVDNTGTSKLISNIENKKGPVTYSVSQSPYKIYSYYVITKAKNYKSNNYIESEKSNIVNLFHKN